MRTRKQFKKPHKQETPHNLVRLHDYLVYKSSYFLSPVSTKILYYAIAKKFQPNTPAEELETEIFIPLRELSQAIVETEKTVVEGVAKKSSNSLYETVEGVIQELSNLKFYPEVGLEIDGNPVSDIITVCPRVRGGKGKNKEKGVFIRFDRDVIPFLFKLRRYVLVHRTEINKLSSGYSIKLYQLLRGIINRKKKFGVVYCTETLSLTNLHFLLNTQDQESYKEFKYFNKNVLKKSVKDIVNNTSIELDIASIRTKPKDAARRCTTHIKFTFHDKLLLKKKNPSKQFAPTATDLEELTLAEKNAYDILVKFGVVPGIAFCQIIPFIEGSESIGFEDFFVQGTVNYFEKYSKNQDTPAMKVATFVNWWTKHKYFSIGNDAWSVVNEKVVQTKKTMQEKDYKRFKKRMYAKDMTAKEYQDAESSSNEFLEIG